MIVEKRFSDLEVIVWSIFGSICIYVVFSAMSGGFSIEQVKGNVFDWQYLSRLMFLSVFGGAMVGGLGRLLFRRGLFPGNCWEVAFNQIRLKGSYVLVYTEDGRDFKGMVKHYTAGEPPYQLLVEKPKLILRDEKFNVLSELEYGKRVLFTGNTIKEVVFL